MSQHADPLDVAADKLSALGADVAETNAICCMIDLYGFPDDLAEALRSYRLMSGRPA